MTAAVEFTPPALSQPLLRGLLRKTLRTQYKPLLADKKNRAA